MQTPGVSAEDWNFLKMQPRSSRIATVQRLFPHPLPRRPRPPIRIAQRIRPPWVQLLRVLPDIRFWIRRRGRHILLAAPLPARQRLIQAKEPEEEQHKEGDSKQELIETLRKVGRKQHSSPERGGEPQSALYTRSPAVCKITFVQWLGNGLQTLGPREIGSAFRPSSCGPGSGIESPRPGAPRSSAPRLPDPRPSGRPSGCDRGHAPSGPVVAWPAPGAAPRPG